MYPYNSEAVFEMEETLTAMEAVSVVWKGPFTMDGCVLVITKVVTMP